MINENELKFQVELARTINFAFYPQSDFKTPLVGEGSANQPLLAMKDIVSGNMTDVIRRANEVIKNETKLKLFQTLGKTLAKKLKNTIDQKESLKFKDLLIKAIAIMPSVHRMVARKDLKALKATLPIVCAMRKGLMQFETYGQGHDYHDLTSNLDLLNQNLLHIAALNNDYNTFHMLMKHQVVNERDCIASDIQGLTPVKIILCHTHHADKKVSHPALLMLNALIKKGWLKLDAPCLGNQTLLHYAAGTNNIVLCKYLLKLKANVNVTNVLDGNTALHYACHNNCPEAAELLINAGASTSILNAKGSSARQLALDYAADENETLCFFDKALVARKTEQKKANAGISHTMTSNSETCPPLYKGDAKTSDEEVRLSRIQSETHLLFRGSPPLRPPELYLSKSLVSMPQSTPSQTLNFSTIEQQMTGAKMRDRAGSR